MDIAKLDTAAFTAARTASPPVEARPRAPEIAASTAAAQEAASPADPRAVAAAVDSANAYIQSQPQASSLEFSIDRDSGRTVVKMVDTETKEVVRQFPSEEMLAISRSIEKMSGLMINEKA